VEDIGALMAATDKKQKSKLLPEEEQEAKDLLSLVNKPSEQYPLALQFSSPENNALMKQFPRLESYDEATPIAKGKCKGKSKCEATCLLVDDNLFNLIPLEVMLNDIAKIKVLKA